MTLLPLFLSLPLLSCITVIIYNLKNWYFNVLTGKEYVCVARLHDALEDEKKLTQVLAAYISCLREIYSIRKNVIAVKVYKH